MPQNKAQRKTQFEILQFGLKRIVLLSSRLVHFHMQNDQTHFVYLSNAKIIYYLFKKKIMTCF